MISKHVCGLVWAAVTTTSIHGFTLHPTKAFYPRLATTTTTTIPPTHSQTLLSMSDVPDTPPSSSTSIDDITDNLLATQTKFTAALSLASTLPEFESLRDTYLGRKGSINGAMSNMRLLSNDDKPKLGPIVNQIKSELNSALEVRMTGVGVVFPEPPKEEKAAKKSKKQEKAPEAEFVMDISKLDLRVGIITKAWEHEEGDKLFCEQIDIGEPSGPRNIASGLRAHYQLPDLEGQRVVVLANLKTRKLMGFPSHGMVLCAAEETESGIVEFVEPPPGAVVGERVMVDGFDGEPATENQIVKKKVLNAIFPDLTTDGNGVATYKNVALSTSAGPCVAQNKLANAPVG